MVNKSILYSKRLFIITITIVFLFLSCAPIFSQENYSLEQTEDGSFVFVQKLTWQPIENILCYDVILEQKTLEGYEQIDKIRTEESSVDVSLEAGEYRFRILVYNLLEKVEIETEWFEFKIIRALQPEVTKLEPLVIYLEEDNDGIYGIEGVNLLEDATYELKDETKGNSYTGQISEYENDQKLKITFDLNKIESGDYNLVVTNPGGLAAKSELITIKFKKLMDLDVAFGYVCPVVVRDDTIKTYFGSNVLPISATAKVTFIPFKKRFGYFGIGLVASYTRLNTKFEAYELDGNLLTSHFNIVYQFPIIKQRLMLDVHGGAGVVLFNNVQFHFQRNLNSEALNSFSMTADAGLAIQYYVLKRLFIEVGCDYVMSFMTDMALDLVQPMCSVGWQF